MNRLGRLLLFVMLPLVLHLHALADDEVTPVKPGLTAAAMEEASKGCLDCHTHTDAPSMHKNKAVSLGCAHCHGGSANVRADGLIPGSVEYEKAKSEAHVLPSHPEWWPGSGNAEGSYTKLLKESAEFVKFMNPGDLRVAAETCGGCHSSIVTAMKKSLMTTSAMFWEGASYNNNILPNKTPILGESYGRNGEGQKIETHEPICKTDADRGVLQSLLPIPQWEVVPPGDVFRVFERGGSFIRSQFPEIGNPNPEEAPGRPDVKASNRGPGTGNRIAVPVLNIHKTRLNDPHLSMMGTNDHPGDYRASGCTSCHVIYANDRDEKHSGPYARFGHEGKTQTTDPTIPKEESGHPLSHAFTRAIPTSQCMVCHMHQPNMFVNSFLGFTMWDYESDAPRMWPKEQRDPSDEEMWKSLDRNPEEAAARGLWNDSEFLKWISDKNKDMKDTQFADYHGHGWNFRAVFKRDRKGNLLDKDGHLVTANDPDKFKKAVHLADIHLEKGMHCVDCHFGQDSHGDGKIYGEVAQAIEVQCQDCHGTVKSKATLKTSGPAAPKGGTDLSLMRTSFGKERFLWRGGKLYQRSNLDPNVEWLVKQVRDSVDPGSAEYNPRAARAKLVEASATDAPERKCTLAAVDSGKASLAHKDESMTCYSCHSSWATSCGGCHLPIQANWKQTSKHYDGKETRNWASYNPQVARDDMYQLGLHGPVKGGKIAPVRSSSALVLSSTDINRQKIYVQQPPTSAAGYSSQAFSPHFPHTVRTTETKGCDDCHVSKQNDNNAILAQLFLLGTNFVNFMGYHVYLGTGDGVEAVQVTEWTEPQAVIGSYLQRYAYPRNFAEHEGRDKKLQFSESNDSVGTTTAVQLRGEYLFTTAGRGGFRVYDVANIANKGFSEKIVTAPVSPLGQDTHVASKNATYFALPTTMPIAPFREHKPENLERPMHPIYHYAVVTDSEEGLILVNVDTFADGEPRNNFLDRALTWNSEGILTGARYVTLAGARAYVCTHSELVVVNLDSPLEPRIEARMPFNDPRAVQIQFRYAFVVDADGMHAIDITDAAKPRKIEKAFVPLVDGRNIYLARTFAYVAGGKEGLVIVDIERPEEPKLYMRFNDDGHINDLNDVKIATTNASLFAYLADGENGLKVVQLTDPERVPNFYGFSPDVKPLVIAWKETAGPALAISKPLDRDRAVDETGNQVSVFGRIGSRPFNEEERERFYKREDGSLYQVDSK